MVEHPDSVRTGINRANNVVTGTKIAASGATFETDQAMGTTPTLYMDLTSSTGDPVKNFLLEEVVYMMNPTNAVTYQLWLEEQASADDDQQKADIVFATPAAQADSTIYGNFARGHQEDYAAPTEAYYLPRIVKLTTAGRLYYQLDWSGAPGNTAGFIKVRGRLLK